MPPCRYGEPGKKMGVHGDNAMKCTELDVSSDEVLGMRTTIQGQSPGNAAYVPWKAVVYIEFQREKANKGKQRKTR
jgi:hypothetical protein